MVHAMNEQTTPRAASAAATEVPTPRDASTPVEPQLEEKRGDDLPSEVKVTLGRPISTHMGPKTEFLVFREPTAMDIDAVGNPIINDWSRGWPPNPIIDAKRMTTMMARLANISPKSILEMRARDWSTCSLAVSIFFLPDLGKF
jgi:hypothetical protein